MDTNSKSKDKSKNEKQTAISKDNVVVDSETELLTAQVTELSALVQTLLEQNKKLEEKSNTDNISKNTNSLYETEEERLDIDPREYIRVVSLTDGGLNLSTNTSVIRFNDFGTSKSVTFEDIRAIVDNHPLAAKEGAFLIQSEKAVKALYLTEEYERMMNKDQVENIIKFPITEIKNTLDSVGKILKETIISRIIKGIVSGSIMYQDRSKINEIGNHIGKDLYKIVAEIEDNNK
ncbi:hypothetical protein NV379_02615 [Paenibacillus sp. N1-5-1-14]|uniref:hypothetical protein n=1 Tax=Paenibacillus radicibacter TaxID=2972488 RepID=UPI002159673C|nr:hypothetical protein [Paenibacillus radicibacter]MCR8641539.1 hypothetical protein [Paenibacillus radicibacter]